MKGRRLIEKIALRGLLSYGPEPLEAELGPLNVLIGPNASGKSNFIAALSLLRAAPDDLAVPLRKGGGPAEWLWKGGGAERAEISARVALPRRRAALVHTLRFSVPQAALFLEEESIDAGGGGPVSRARGFFHRLRSDAEALEATSPRPTLGSVKSRREVELDWSMFSSDQSVLSQLKDPKRYPEIAYLGREYRQIRLYVDSDLGRHSPPRLPQPADLPGDFLLEDASNLGMVLNDLDQRSTGLKAIEDQLRRFYEPVERISTKVRGGTVQLYLHERGLGQPVSALRLSDGFLRYLCLLTILLHPSPPPLVCIEEPELGLHPDVLPTMGELLIEASQRTQLIVTTHSDLLVSALGDVPEAVLVCERDEQGTHLRRLERDKLKEWLDEYTLGDLWLRGQIGGTTT